MSKEFLNTTKRISEFPEAEYPVNTRDESARSIQPSRSVTENSIPFPVAEESMTGELMEKPKRFFVDATVLRLGKWLRFLGIDTPFASPDSPISPGACLLTKKRSMHEKGHQRVVVPYDDLKLQLLWFAGCFPYTIHRNLFGSRCLRCNHILLQTPREDVRDEVPDYTYQTHEIFMKCPTCQRIYWEGSHKSRMLDFLEHIGFPLGGGI